MRLITLFDAASYGSADFTVRPSYPQYLNATKHFRPAAFLDRRRSTGKRIPKTRNVLAVRGVRELCSENSQLAHPRGFEPLASAFGGQRSIRLSYGCADPCLYTICSKIANSIMRTVRGRIQVLPPICPPRPLCCRDRMTRGRSRSFPNVPSKAARNDGLL